MQSRVLHTPLLVIDALAPEPERIEQAASALASGEVIILPTDTVYGIALLASDTADPNQLFHYKQRSEDKSIPLLVAEPSALSVFGSCVPDYASELAEQHWPGALTLVVQASSRVPEQFISSDGSIALRMPAHAITLALLQAVGAPIATSSANLSGKAPALSIDELDRELANRVSLIVDGGSLGGGVPSTVVSCLEAEPEVLRTGPILI